ncbi:hypothetical protein DN435_07900 [Lactobacillus reuteri]|uniref:hypothetical protein n=1 Tax=Limosilactobacillus reuteri TaxID=1598 RepID=UPI00128C4CCD|nr:hypothetical protein [Limosilactobacillus reuteri]MQB79331.1 hypothetical protein [Limosilactobacillus reuteri]
MISKDYHTTYLVNRELFLENFDYLWSFNNKAEQVITVKQGDKVIGYYLPPFSAKKLDQKIEDDETKHRQDLLLIKELRKQIKVLDARNKLQVDLNEDNNTSL